MAVSSCPYVVNDDVIQRRGGKALSRKEMGRECPGGSEQRREDTLVPNMPSLLYH